jgi:hypothetical protein
MGRKIDKPKVKREEIISKIVDMRVNRGWSILTILEFLKTELKYKPSYAYELINESRDYINNSLSMIFGDSLKEDIERFESLYQNAILNKNIREARELLKEISKLKGHYIERVELSGNIDFTVKFPGVDDD